MERLDELLRVELAASAAGGRPSDRYRKHVVAMLAVNAQRLGVKATPTAGRPFTNLCQELVTIMGLRDDGLEIEVARVLEQLRKEGRIKSGQARNSPPDSKPAPD